MARVTAEDVRAIIDIDENIGDLTPFITQANLMVTNTFSGDATTGADTLKEIERNIAAHLICGRDPRAIEEKNGDVSVKYSGKFEAGLQSTPYGQSALLMDPTGKLAKLGMRKASIGMIDYSVTR